MFSTSLQPQSWDKDPFKDNLEDDDEQEEDDADDTGDYGGPGTTGLQAYRVTLEGKI